MAHIKHTHEEKLAKSKRICDVYAEGENDIESCCDSEGITYPTFKNWCYEILEILEAYKQSRNKSDIARKGKIRQYALSSLAKAVKGYDYTETTTEARDVKTGKVHKDGEFEGEPIYKPKITKRVTKVITVQPNPTLIMFALNNSNIIEDATFNHASKVDVTTKGESIAPANPLSVLSTDLLEQIEAQLKEKEENE